MSAISSASAGMVTALLRFERASTQAVARASTGDDIVDPMIEIAQAKAQFIASAAVLRTADEIARAVLDIKV